MSRPRKPFWLIVIDEDKGVFTLEGPMMDDRDWTQAVYAAQLAGRHVRCSASEKALMRDEMINHCSRQLGMTVSEKPILEI